MAEWEMEFGSEPPERVGNLMRVVVDGQMARHMTANQRAAAAWYRANGDRERNHTTGVFLKRSRVAGAAPVLGVYVDSHAMVTDFGVNKDLYLARLANIGYEVSGIEFLPSRKGARPSERPARKPAERPQELPPLDEREAREVEQLVADLPDSLKPSVSKAIALSLRKEKLKKTQTDKQS